MPTSGNSAPATRKSAGTPCGNGRPPGCRPREVLSLAGVPDRRPVLRSGLAVATRGAVGAATGCTGQPASSAAAPARHHLIGPGSPQVAAAEAARHASGTALAGVAPVAGHVDLGGPVVETWSYGGQVPGLRSGYARARS